MILRPADSAGAKIAKHSVRIVMAVGTLGVAGLLQSDLDDRTAMAEGRMSLDEYASRSRQREALGAALTGGHSTVVTPNAYGLGVNSDQFGRPHTYQLRDGTPVAPIFQGGVRRDAYGLGVHSDQFGRPVYDSPRQ